MKFIRLSCLLLLCAIHVSGQQTKKPLTVPNGKISFTWQGDSLHQEWEPHAAILIPVRLPGCSVTWYMQFDLGAPRSVFYSRTLEAIRNQYPGCAIRTDTTTQTFSGRFKAGNIDIQATAIPVQTFGNNILNTARNSINIIGTIGADLIDNKVVMIDYPRTTITLADTVSPAIAITGFSFIQGRVLLPVVLQGKRSVLYFDTGSSSFELLIDKATWSQLADSTAAPVRYPVKSWNNTMYANTIATSQHIEVAGVTLPLNHVTYMEGASSTQIKQMMQLGINGMTGNKLFLQHTLVLDTRNRKFGLIGK